jgi:hypothetical protein
LGFKHDELPAHMAQDFSVELHHAVAGVQIACATQGARRVDLGNDGCIDQRVSVRFMFDEFCEGLSTMFVQGVRHLQTISQLVYWISAWTYAAQGQ